MAKVNQNLLDKVASMIASNSNISLAPASDLDAKAVVNIEENVFVKDDVFSIPDTREEAEKVLIKEVFTNLPMNANGEYPVGYSILVEVTNKSTKMTTIKKFRFTAPRNSFAEYKLDEANNIFVATGRTIGPNNDLARTMKNFNNQGQMLDYLLGKTLEVTEEVSGMAARMENRVVKTLYRRTLPVFTEVKKKAAKE